jgi:hypothetical protein
MKAILALAVLAMTGSAFADPIFTQADLDRIHSENESLSRYLASGPKMTDTIPSNEEACRPSKVDFTIVSLPDGQTATGLTFH